MHDPNTTLANQEVRFGGGRFAFSNGRNGVMRTVGVFVGGTGFAEAVRIHPINTRDVGQGHVEVPIQDIDALCKALQQVKQKMTIS